MGDLFNLRKQLAFYGAYHSHPLYVFTASNKLIRVHNMLDSGLSMYYFPVCPIISLGPHGSVKTVLMLRFYRNYSLTVVISLVRF